jgi:hypothetical protein
MLQSGSKLRSEGATRKKKEKNHGVISQKIDIFITTAVRTSNTTCYIKTTYKNLCNK